MRGSLQNDNPQLGLRCFQIIGDDGQNCRLIEVGVTSNPITIPAGLQEEDSFLRSLRVCKSHWFLSPRC